MPRRNAELPEIGTGFLQLSAAVGKGKTGKRKIPRQTGKEGTRKIEMKRKSKIEKWILDPSFDYAEPWFYSHTYSLRCELGIGESRREYRKKTRGRAEEIFDVLFCRGVDALFLEYAVEDPTLAEGTPKQIHLDLMTRVEKKSLKWFYGWKKYPHRLVLNVPKSDDEDVLRVNRLVCYFDKAERIDFKKLVVKNIDKNIFHLVSFENECIFSVYDDRGCDIVFADKEKYAEYFEKLNEYLLPYDLKRMRRMREEKMFIDDVRRKKLGGTAYFEFQFCKKTGSVRELAKGKPYRPWLEDSLYFYVDYDEIFFREYGEYFSSPTTPNGEHRFDYYGINYYTKEQAEDILKRIKADAPPESPALISWLENAAQEYNGFFLLGI